MVLEDKKTEAKNAVEVNLRSESPLPSSLYSQNREPCGSVFQKLYNIL